MSFRILDLTVLNVMAKSNKNLIHYKVNCGVDNTNACYATGCKSRDANDKSTLGAWLATMIYDPGRP